MDVEPGLSKLLGSLWQDAEELTSRALDRHVRLAVTGLRRSGKTVFITSMVQALMNGRGLPFVKAVHDGRYLGARLIPVEGSPFPFDRFREALSANQPVWPKATDTLSSIKLEIRRKSAAMLTRHVQPIQPLTVEVIDYPGEWLLDLPLLEQGYDRFCEEAFRLAARPERRAAAKPWLDRLAAIDHSSASDEIRAVNRSFKDYLAVCQRDLGLWNIQPGHFVHPGDLDDLEILEFSPTPQDFPQTFRSLMRECFDAYKRDVVGTFYDRHFKNFDRQIVLVDLLGLLNDGPDHFADAQACLAGIIESFRYGRESLLGRLFTPSIERVIFAVSKADHVAANQHPNLKQLLELMIAEAARKPRFEGIDHEILALSALRSTDTVRTEHQGQTLSCVRGRLKNEDRETVLFPGEIPAGLPDDEDWRSGRFRFFEFAPRPISADMTGRHIRLDQAIEYLIGDKLG